MHPSSWMGRTAFAFTHAVPCLALLAFMPAAAAAAGSVGAGAGFRAAAPAGSGFHAAPRGPIARPQMQRPAPQHFGHPGAGYPALAQRSFGHQRGGMPPLGGTLYGHVNTGPRPYPRPLPVYGYGHPGAGQPGYHRRRFAAGSWAYPFGGYGGGTTIVEPSVVTQYAEPPLQGYYGYYGGAGLAPAPCVAPIIIQIGPLTGSAGRLLPRVVQGGGAGGCGVPQVVTYARADASPRVIDGVGHAPRGKRKHAVRARY